MKKLVYLLYALPFLLFIAFNAFSTAGTYTRAVSGSTATAAYINNGWDYYRDAINAVLNGDDYTGNNRMLSGTDWTWCSDSSCSNETAKIYGDSGIIVGALTQQGMVNNCDLSYSSGTLTINGKGGVALAATNPCYITVASSTAGQTDVATFTANVTATDGASSQTDGNLFGITDADWSNAMPLFIGVIDAGTIDLFTMSRIPVRSSGTAGQLCQLTDTDCDSQSDVMILSTGQVLANFASKPITQVGWIQGTYATSGGAWTFSLNANSGFNQNYSQILWSFPTGQMGALTSNYLSINNSGTRPPTWATPANINAKFTINASGYVDYNIDTIQAGNCTNGLNADDLRLHLPYKTSSTAHPDDTLLPGSGRYSANAAGSGPDGLLSVEINTPGESWGRLIGTAETDGFTNILATHFNDSGDDFNINLRFKAF